ncbi:MBL fold metallo-hydrolase [Paenibacillus kobensis]|uniref:MBL fold metallo-hydrolase n=1 Tax=Paenibacillus kobensis TaxID=59841 RepID=UPI000FDB017B|nr:MBL fold metallo-hydrolase [Paenibacillus kobensis]
MAATYELYTLRLHSEPFINYSYLIVDTRTREAAVIDPAWELNPIRSLIASKGAVLKSILLTHSHHDHTNLVKPLVSLYGCDVHISRDEAAFYSFRCDRLTTFEDGQQIRIGDTAITCILTPGHSYGGACFAAEGSLFTGDTLYIEGCGICTTAGGDPEAMFDSIQRIKTIVQPETRIYPGHSFGMPPGCTFDQLEERNIYYSIDKKEAFVSFRMRRTNTLFQFQ